MAHNDYKVFTDRLLWVHHDANNMKAVPHRQRVFSHVQKNYRPWKRREDNQHVRLIVWKEPRVQDIDPRNGEQTRSERDRAPFQGLCATPITATPGSRNTRELISRPPSPVSPVGKGNSDPFNAFSIPIGPYENNFVSFYRDYVVSLMKHIGRHYLGVKKLAAGAVQDSIRGLEDRGTALAILARSSAIRSKCSPGTWQVALDFLGQSTSVLREKVSGNQQLDGEFDCLHINMLFNTEVINRNLPGAVAHGKIFLHIFKRQWTYGELDYKMLLYQLHNDLQMTSTFLVPSIFDVDDWLLTVLSPMLSHISVFLPMVSDEALDPAIEDESVRYWFRRRRQNHRWEALQTTKTCTLPNLPLLENSYIAYNFLFHSRMIGHFLRSEERLAQEKLTDEEKNHLYAHQYLVLAAVLELKWSVFSPQVMGIPIYDDTILSISLQRVLGASDLATKSFGRDKYINARIWALYIGALVERGTPQQQAPTNQQWFNRALAEQACNMNIATWDALAAIFQGFLYDDRLLSQGSTWFAELVLTYRLGRKTKSSSESLNSLQEEIKT